MVEMHVVGLALDEKNQAPVLILKDEAEQVVLPIWIGAMEAMSISMVLNKVAFPRPMTHDLLLATLRDLGGRLDAIEVTRMEGGTFFAELVVDVEGEARRIDSRPSDAIALALRCDAVIRVAPAVLEEAGAPAEPEQEAVLSDEEAEKWTEELENLSIDDLKYKM